MPMILVDTKADLANDREITCEEGHQLARNFGCGYLEISAIDEDSTKDPFYTVSIRFPCRFKTTLSCLDISYSLVKRKTKKKPFHSGSQQQRVPYPPIRMEQQRTMKLEPLSIFIGHPFLPSSFAYLANSHLDVPSSCVSSRRRSG